MSHPQSYEILLIPEFAQEPPADGSRPATDTGSGPDARASGTPIRSAVVAATGETGASGYPRYAGDGIVADIDPASQAVEALLVDGAELDYGLSVRVSERPAQG